MGSFCLSFCRLSGMVGAGGSRSSNGWPAGAEPARACRARAQVNSGPTSVEAVAPTGEFLALSEYKAKFVSELGAVAEAAPALTE